MRQPAGDEDLQVVRTGPELGHPGRVVLLRPGAVHGPGALPVAARRRQRPAAGQDPRGRKPAAAARVAQGDIGPVLLVDAADGGGPGLQRRGRAGRRSECGERRILVLVGVGEREHDGQVGVHGDQAGQQVPAAEVEHRGALGRGGGDRHDPPVGDPDRPAGRHRPVVDVDDGGVGQPQVCHRSSSGGSAGRRSHQRRTGGGCGDGLGRGYCGTLTSYTPVSSFTVMVTVFGAPAMLSVHWKLVPVLTS